MEKTGLKWGIYFLLGISLGCVAYLLRAGIEFLGDWKLDLSAHCKTPKLLNL